MTEIRRNAHQWDLSDNAWHPLFSNFTNMSVVLPPRMFAMTPEHAYQALKTEDLEQRLWILQAPSPGQAKRRGRKVTLRPNWYGAVGINAMIEVVQARCDQHPPFLEALLATGDRTIIEVTRWRDLVWGTDLSGFGANQLGQILMQEREAHR